MKWVEPAVTGAKPEVPGESPNALTEKQNEGLKIARRSGRHDKVAALLEALADSGRHAQVDWSALSDSYLAQKMPRDALEACLRGERSGSDQPRLPLAKARALAALGRIDEAIEVFEREFSATANVDALFGMLRLLVRSGKVSELLNRCDSARSLHGDNTVLRAMRSIGYSMDGQSDRANELVDLERHVAVSSLESAHVGDVSGFNQRLAEEAHRLIDPPLGFTLINEVHHPSSSCPAFQELRSIVQDAVEDYVRQAPDRGLDKWLPPDLPPLRLRSGVTMVRAGGTAGQHVHRTSLFSIVYHVEVPDEILEARDGRGDLQIGAVDRFTGGHRACWGERRLRARPGQLTIFPAHFFHDVIPTGVDPIRTSMVFDVIPA